MFEFFRRHRHERQLDAEIRFQIHRMAQDYVSRGIAPQEARRRARIEFGGAEQIKEECRDSAPSAGFPTPSAICAIRCALCAESGLHGGRSVVPGARNRRKYGGFQPARWRRCCARCPSTTIDSGWRCFRTLTGTANPSTLFRIRNMYTCTNMRAEWALDGDDNIRFNLSAGAIAHAPSGELVSDNYFQLLGSAARAGTHARARR